MQLFEDVSGALVLLFLSIIGWMMSKWTHGRFAAFMRTREAELAKLQKIDTDADASLLADSESGGHEAPRSPLVRSNRHNDTTEKSPQMGAQNRRRVRRRAKTAKLEADSRPAKVELVMSSQAETSDTFTSQSDQEPGSAVVVTSTLQIEEQIDESKADLIVSVPEVVADRFPAKEEPSEAGNRDDVLSAPESIRMQRTEIGLSDETKLSQRSVSHDLGGDEKETQDASLQTGSSTHGGAEEDVSSSEDDSMLGKSSLASASLGASVPTHSIPTYPTWMSSADSRFHMHGDGWMMSFDELQFAQSKCEMSTGTMTSLFGQQQIVGEPNPVTDKEHAFTLSEAVSTRSIDARGPKSYTEGELVYESAEQTPVAVIHSEHAFVIGGRVFTPFTDVHGQQLYTDGEIVYDATLEGEHI